MKWSMFPEVDSAWARVQDLFLGVIVPGLVALVVAIVTIVMAFRWVHKASRDGRHAGGSWEGASGYASAHFDDEMAGGVGSHMWSEHDRMWSNPIDADPNDYYDGDE